MHAKSLRSCLTLCDPMDCSTPGSSVCGILQARKEYWSGLPCPPTGNLPDPGIEPTSLASYLLHQQAGSLRLAPPGKPGVRHNGFKFQLCPWMFVSSRLQFLLPLSVSQDYCDNQMK